MKDIYYKDTVKAVDKFEKLFSDMRHLLSDEFQESYNLLAAEVNCLLSEYSDNLDEIRSLKDKVEVLESQVGDK